MQLWAPRWCYSLLLPCCICPSTLPEKQVGTCLLLSPSYLRSVAARFSLTSATLRVATSGKLNRPFGLCEKEIQTPNGNGLNRGCPCRRAATILSWSSQTGTEAEANPSPQLRDKRFPTGDDCKDTKSENTSSPQNPRDRVGRCTLRI